MIYIYSFFMFLMFNILMIYSFFFFFFYQSLILEWTMLSFNSFNIEMLLLIDWISLLFISTVLMISMFILIYSMNYMKMEIFILRYYFLLILFIFSMILMIISPNLISIMFGWDGLGLSSFCLVIFYQNYSSYNSGMTTILMNRLGDIFILMSISLMIFQGSWNIFMLNINIKLNILLILLASMTKSAQLPFSQWLPMAMAAPTPISALVHSSTLVTAGVYLLIRFSKFLNFNNLNLILFFMSLLTMFMSSLMANFEYDLKKIIALSTLSQLGLMMMILSLGFFMLSFFHLLIHAIFKSLLFMSAGNIIHFLNNNQDIRLIGNLNEYLPFSMMSFQMTLFALIGFPFMSGFYTKDLIMEMIYFNKLNYFMMILSLMSLMFTLFYSLRLLYYLMFKEMNMNTSMFLYENKIMNFSMILFMIFSVIQGSLINWMFFYNNFIFLNFFDKIFTMLILLMSLMIYLVQKMFNFYLNYFLMYLFSSMWFLNYLIKYMNKLLIKFSYQSFKQEKYWMELLSINLFMYLIFNFKNYFMNLNYKLFMFMFLFILMIMIFYM